MEDRLYGIFMNVMERQISEWHDAGLSDDEIREKLHNIDLTKLEGAHNKLADRMVEDLEAKMYKRVLEERALTNEFVARHEQVWGQAFVASEAMHIAAIESAQDCSKFLDSMSEDELCGNGDKLHVLRVLHARACQQYAEVICLVKAGFADGAFARWRSLYELTVVAQFIADNTAAVAKSYMDAAETDDDSWNNWAKAAPCFQHFKPRANIKFSDIERQCSFSSDPWKKLYKLSCKTLHPSPFGSFSRICCDDTENLLCVGRSNYGVAIAAEHAAIALAVISAIFFSQLSYWDGLAYASALLNWVKVVEKYYRDAEQEHFSETE